MLFLTVKRKLNSIAFNFVKKSLIKAVSAVTVFNITYGVFNAFFVIIFYNFKAYDITLFIINNSYLVINLKMNKLLTKLEFTAIYNPKLLY